MIKKTFETLKKNPVIILGFAIPIILIAAASIPLFGSINEMLEVIRESVNMGQEPDEYMMLSSMGGYFTSILLILVLSLLLSFLVVPTVFNKVYEACSDKNEPGWVGRGLQRSWWKIFVAGMIVWAITSVVAGVGVIIIFIPVLGILAYYAAIFALAVFALIAYTAVIAEDDFGTGLSRIFQVGSKYFWKLLGTYALALVPVMLAYIGWIVYVILGTIPLVNTVTTDLIATEYMSDIFSSLWIILVASSAYYIFAAPFIYTYSMHQYLEKRDVLLVGNATQASDGETTASE